LISKIQAFQLHFKDISATADRKVMDSVIEHVGGVLKFVVRILQQCIRRFGGCGDEWKKWDR
jgi:hypothetical protein